MCDLVNRFGTSTRFGGINLVHQFVPSLANTDIVLSCIAGQFPLSAAFNLRGPPGLFYRANMTDCSKITHI